MTLCHQTHFLSLSITHYILSRCGALSGGRTAFCIPGDIHVARTRVGTSITLTSCAQRANRRAPCVVHQLPGDDLAEMSRPRFLRGHHSANSDGRRGRCSGTCDAALVSAEGGCGGDASGGAGPPVLVSSCFSIASTSATFFWPLPLRLTKMTSDGPIFSASCIAW